MSYVRNAWYVAAWSEDIAPQTPFAITILGERIVIYRTASGGLAALEDRCAHRLAPLSRGRCEGEALRCMYHGLLFEPDGRVSDIPGQDVIPEKARVRAYPALDLHDWIWVWMGDPAMADPALAPPAIGPRHPDWIMGRGELDYAAEARLINDNLLDFAHLSYVHAQSFGASETWARSRPKVTQLARGVRFERWIVGEKGMRAREGGDVVDAWSSYDFLLPGVLLMTSGAYPAGTAEASGFGPPDPALQARNVTFTSQAVTPMGAQTARYFFCWGPRKDQGDEGLRDTLMGIAAQAFAEDKAMIEAQQGVLNETPDPHIMPTTSDQGVLMFNRLVEQMARAELIGG